MIFRADILHHMSEQFFAAGFVNIFRIYFYITNIRGEMYFNLRAPYLLTSHGPHEQEIWYFEIRFGEVYYRYQVQESSQMLGTTRNITRIFWLHIIGTMYSTSVQPLPVCRPPSEDFLIASAALIYTLLK